MAPTRYVIVGGGLAAATAAEQVRERDASGVIHLYAGESHDPYIRPPLSKELMLGKDGRDSVFVHPADWYREHEVVLTTGRRAARIGDHLVELSGGTEVPFDRLLLATGATPRTLGVPGEDAPGIHALRTLEDSETLKALLESGGRNVVVVGAGWIGLELAAAARTYGNEVTVVAPGSVPLGRALGDEMGEVFRTLHEQNGVTFRMNTRVAGFAADAGRVTAVETDSGTVAADLVIVGVGAEPDTALAAAAGLEIDDGVLVDEHLATSAPDVFAAGDVANAYHPVIRQRMRNEHWANAIAGGKVAGAAMAGADASLDDIPYFYTDQYDLGMEYSGYPPLARDAEVVTRGDRAGREFIAFWLAGDRVVAGMNVNVWDVNEDVQTLIRRDAPVDRVRLADPSIPLTEV
jgi:3-phenylpropionate/trans-cinnamate dioxygenase ferredoxin reductase component